MKASWSPSSGNVAGGSPPKKPLNTSWATPLATTLRLATCSASDNQWTHGKGFDTFCPLGPWIETEFDPSDALITCHVNGELRQMGSTRDMVFSVRHLIAYASSIMTLEPGDVLLTGTPAGIGPLQPGDIVEVTVEGLGTLTNPVAAEQAH